MKYNLIDDISSLSLIKPSILNKLIDISQSCLCDYVDNMSILEDSLVEVDIGIGTLNIFIEEDAIKYQFKPSKKLEKNLVQTVVDGNSPLTYKIEKKLNKKILNTYKELL